MEMSASAVSELIVGKSPAEPTVCTIVLAFGKTDELVYCLESLRSQIGVHQQICVVQNGAPESLLDEIAESFPEVRLIRNGANVGAAAGRNIGIAWAEVVRPDYLFFMDNDATLAPNALEILIGVAQSNSEVGFLGCVIYRKYEPNIVFSAGALMRRPLFDDHICKFDSETKSFQVDFVGIGAMLVPSHVVQSVGYLDEALYLNDEDTDWCLRGKEAGLKTLVVTQAAAFHDIPRGKFNPRHVYYTTRNRLVVAKRHGYFNSLWQAPVLRSLLERSLKMLVSTDEAAWTCLLALWIGVMDFRRNRLGRCREWMETPRSELAEARLRRRLWASPVWGIARQFKRRLHLRQT